MPAVAAFLLALAVTVSGATPTPRQAAPAPRPAAPGKSQKPPQRPDATVEAAIRARFAKSKIAADKFEVRVQGGVAIIEGRTDVMQHKGVATRLARSAGAAAVNNRIQISEAARAKASANLQKGRRRVQVKRGASR